MMRLQRAVGNRATRALLGSLVPPKLTVNEPGDAYEQEADRIADAVLRIPGPVTATSTAPSPRLIHRARAPCDQGKALQAKGVSSKIPQVTPQVQARIDSLRGGGRPLDSGARAFFEPLFGRDFSSVRIHVDAAVAETAGDLGARAFTVGRHIGFGAGEYNPTSEPGQKLLAHELAHVVQRDVSDTSVPASGQVVRLSPREKRRRRDPQAVNFETAKAVMYSIIKIINQQELTEPDRWATTEPWFVKYKPLLNDWYAIKYGEKSNGSRMRLKGGALGKRLQAAIVKTDPILQVLEEKGGRQWQELLNGFVYPRIGEFEVEAIEKPPPTTSDPKRWVEFEVRPEPVSLEEFLSVVTAQDSQPVEIARGYGGYSLGTATVGTVFQASKQDTRVLLWSNGQAVFFVRDGQIYGQLARWFSEDIIIGAFILAGQNALGAAILSQLMVELALSFSPWGVLADGVFALEALSRGSWKEAALTFLPGPAVGLAGKTRVGRAAGRAVAETATIGAKVVARTVRFIGRGAYALKGKLMRGIWIIGEGGASAAGKRSYQFFDEVGNTWHVVPETTATDYVKCNTCRFTSAGRAEEAVATKAAADLDELRQLARTDPHAADALWERYQNMSDYELFQRFADEADETAAAVIRQRFPSNEAALQKILGSDYRPPHSATANLRREGREVWRQSLQSGGMTPEERALGWPRNMLATHTEARAVTRAGLRRGDVLRINGQYNPCSSCMRVMQEAATRTGATIRYWWPGGSEVFGP